jgi:hypothetical protein
MSNSRFTLRTRFKADSLSLASVLVDRVGEEEDSFEKSKIVKMNDLRVYMIDSGAEAFGGHAVFYSRRADGPLYRWFFEQELGQWQVSRVNLSKSTLRELCAASWKIVPPALQARIDEHYLG